jgi:hypothetical protein
VDPNAASIPATIAALKANDIAITQGPVSFSEGGHVSVFIRDPDRNVIELRSPDQGEVEGSVVMYRKPSHRWTQRARVDPDRLAGLAVIIAKAR